MQNFKKAAYVCTLGLLIAYMAHVLFTVNTHFGKHISFEQYQLAD